MPAWRTDFPGSWPEDHLVTRREFTKSLALVSFAAFGASGTLAVISTVRRRAPQAYYPQVIAEVDEIAVGECKIFSYPGPDDPCILIRIDQDRFAAFGQKCTHLGCPVVYQPNQNCLYCPCHAGYFAAEDGKVLSGPPPRPLPRIVLDRRGKTISAVGVRI